MPGKLYGVGLGPGDPELVTIKAHTAIHAADVVAYPTARHGRSVARRIAEPHLRGDQIELAMTYPVTTEPTPPPGGYEVAMRGFYDDCAAEIASHLDEGRTVAVLCEGDPFFYGSYMYLHERLAGRYPTVVIPGVTSFSAAAAAAGTPLTKRNDVFTVVPGTLAPEVVEHHLRTSDAAVVLKLGRRFEGVRGALERARVGERAVYVERASSPEERVAPLAEAGEEIPYMSLVLVPSRWPVRGTATNGHRAGELTIVGLGPAGPEWLTGEALSEISHADDLIGYGPYLDRVPELPGQRRHASDNTEELERAQHGLRLAGAGSRVAMISSGDPGIFAMASAVFEAIDGDSDLSVPVRVVPGLSAMQAVASRVGAPLGHDFCVLSLSDRLKPWEVIERRLHAAGEGDLVVALYNPASRSRREQIERARNIMLSHRAPETAVVVARDVGGAGETVTVTTLGELDTDPIDMRTLVVIGSSTTRVIEGSDGATHVYTPRSYPA